MHRYMTFVFFVTLVLNAVSPASRALDLQLKGKTALVTGSTMGIGYATAKLMLAEGMTVIINSRSKEGNDKAIAALKKETGRTPLSIVADVSTREGTDKIIQAFPEVDVLVNNVGRFIPRAFEQTTDDDWYESFNLNVMSGVRLSRHYITGMKQRNWGRIIFISSESALQIPPESIHYGMTKAAQIAVARGLAETVAGTGVTVNSILPGPTRAPDDPRTAQFMKFMGVNTYEELEKKFFTTFRPTSLIKRFARPDEVASLIVYVASPLSSATTGAALRVDGGVVKSAF
jgi:NAD(P)-dependent dehydrogenase (short-subunit alcohol dehydrogenase family)